MAERDPIRAARDEGFNMGTIAALACVRAQDSAVLWGEIVRAAGTQEVLRHALRNESDWAWGGFDRYAVTELGQQEVTEARRAVAAEKRRRNADVSASYQQE
jgi:hypothetical protein